MLNADSSTLKSEREVQPTNRAPITPIVAALSCTERTTLRIPSTELDGNALFSSVTRKLDSSARPAKPSRARARKRSGTKERSAKYAIMAARCVPRSAKNFEKSSPIVREANLSAMTEPLAELTEISSQVEAAVLFDASGAVTAATLPGEAAARVASSARALMESAGQLRDGEITQVEAATGDGSLFVVRDGERLIAAVTRPEPTSG